MLITSKKSKFLNAVLPNITNFRRHFPKNRRSESGANDYEIEWLEDVDLRTTASELKGVAEKLNKLEIIKNNSTTNSTEKNADDWLALGLSGWEGDIHSPLEYMRKTSFNKRIVVEDLETSSRGNFSSSDIFIARSNNPFGHSTKLELRYSINFSWCTDYS